MPTIIDYILLAWLWVTAIGLIVLILKEWGNPFAETIEDPMSYWMSEEELRKSRNNTIRIIFVLLFLVTAATAFTFAGYTVFDLARGITR